MNREYTEHFETYWAAYLRKLEGKIRLHSGTGLPSYTQLNAILRDSALDWSVGDNACGRWLMNLEREAPEKARLIRKILLEDMYFQEEVTVKGMSDTVKVVLPVVGAVAGFGLATVLGQGLIVQAAAAVLPAVVLPGILRSVETTRRNSTTQEAIAKYMQQLELYHTSIRSILSN